MDSRLCRSPADFKTMRRGLKARCMTRCSTSELLSPVRRRVGYLEGVEHRRQIFLNSVPSVRSAGPRGETPRTPCATAAAAQPRLPYRRASPRRRRRPPRDLERRRREQWTRASHDLRRDENRMRDERNRDKPCRRDDAHHKERLLWLRLLANADSIERGAANIFHR